MCEGLVESLWRNRTFPLPALEDAEGDRLPAGMEVIDAHVHLFPPRVYEAIWRWFEAHAWPIRYRLYAEETIQFLLERGVQRIVGLHYSHVPDMARTLNRYAAELAAAHPQVWALGTVLPGEPEAEAIVREALGPLGLRGIKLHCHVQKVTADDPRLDPIYRLCAEAGRPVVIHSGREPASEAYGFEARRLLSVHAMRRVLERHPRLKVVVPHLGADEIEAYADLLGEFEGLWLDTTMMLADYFPQRPAAELLQRWGHRMLYGSDFPNLPYAWDRELKRLNSLPLETATRSALLAGNARKLFG
ncbi:MAG TPA: amidohydrolase family protein [Stenomitos sp.]